MSSKVEIVTVNTPLNSTSFQQQINHNFSVIEESLNKQLQREPQEDVNNAMQQELDMNSYRIINMAEPVNNSDAATKHYVDTTVKPELEANKVVVSDSNGDIVSSSITTTELNTLSGISGNIQEQIDSKQDTISDLAEIRAGAAAGATALQATDLKTINGESVVGEGDIVIHSNIPFNPSWTTDGTTEEFLADVNADVEAVPGMCYIGSLTCSDLPFNGNADAFVQILESSTAAPKVVHVTLTSGTNSPYHWELSYWVIGNTTHNSGWIGFQPELTAGNNITISGTTISAPVMTGASSLAAGTSGTVPQPAIGDQVKFLRGDGTWVDLGVVLVYKGSVATYADLPSSGNTAGDVWNVLADGKNYAWTGTAWDDFGGTITVSLAACTDVDLDNPANGEVLIYNSTDQKWENGSGGFLYNTSNDTNALGVGTSSSANANSTAVGIGANAYGGTGSNTAIGYGATANSGSCLAVGNSSVAKNGSVAVGNSAVAGTYSATGCTAIGHSASTSGTDSTAVGYNSSANGGVTVGARAQSQSTGVAIGKEAQANGEGRIQLGAYGTNNTDNTMNVALKYNLNVQLLDNTGEIPVARYKAFTGTDGVNAGAKGCVPAPAASDDGKFLKSDGTWASAGGGGSVTLNDIASAGNNISFVDNATDYTIAGSCSVDSNYIATNFGANDYIVSGAEIPQSATTWEVGTKVHTASSLSGNAFIFSGFVNETISAGLYQSSATLNAGNGFWFGGAVYEEDIAAANKDMWYKLIFDGTKYSLQTSLDGVYYSEAAYLTNSTKILSTKVQFGVTESGALVQSIDLKETYIKVNGVETWRAVVAGKTTINADVVLSDIAEAGDNITLTTGTVTDNISSTDKIGSPTITREGLFTPTDSSYLLITNASVGSSVGTIFSSNYDWVLTIKFKTPASYTKDAHLWVYAGGYNSGVNAVGFVNNTGKIALNYKISDWANYEGTTTLDTDTDYYARYTHDSVNNKYTVEVSKNGSDWTTEIDENGSGGFYGGTSQNLYISTIDSNHIALQFDLNGLSLTSAYNSTDWKAYTYVASKTVIAAPNALTNLATGSHALSVGSLSLSNTGWAITTFGDSCRPSGSALTLIGYKAEAYNGPSAAVVVGVDSKAKATGSIHLGCYGENNVAGTFTVSLSTDGNWQNTHTYTMCDANGYIPGARMSLQAAGAPTTSTTGTVGQFYVDTTNQDAYICVDDTSSTYTWKKITP